jgi:hypothetical protein
MKILVSGLSRDSVLKKQKGVTGSRQIEVELHGNEKKIVKDSPFCTVDGEQQCTHST